MADCALVNVIPVNTKTLLIASLCRGERGSKEGAKMSGVMFLPPFELVTVPYWWTKLLQRRRNYRKLANSSQFLSLSPEIVVNLTVKDMCIPNALLVKKKGVLPYFLGHIRLFRVLLGNRDDFSSISSFLLFPPSKNLPSAIIYTLTSWCGWRANNKILNICRRKCTRMSQNDSEKINK